jgi:hypothetical protein
MGERVIQTHGERNAYSRGYNRGRARSSDWAMKLLDLCRKYRDRALAGEGVTRRCEGCSRWRRGHGAARWGRCLMAGDSSAWLSEPGAWTERADGRQYPAADLITHEDFGCTNWLPKTPSPKEHP